MLGARVSWRELSFSLVALSTTLFLGACSTKGDFQEDPHSATDAGLTDTVGMSDASSASGARTRLSRRGGQRAETPAEATEGEHRSYRAHSRAPKIAASPFQSPDGRWLNAFYFVRSDNESWESISTKLYGRPDRAEFLKTWNSSRGLAPGEVVYYNSPSRPEDTSEMKTFARDFGFELENVTVRKDDWMSKLGAARYGDVRSWREIAALNPEISNPDLIEIGQVLRVQPVQIDTAPVLQKIIAQLSKPVAKPEAAPADAAPSIDEAAVAGTVQTPTESAPPSFDDAVAEEIDQAPVAGAIPPQKKERPQEKLSAGPPDYAYYAAGAALLLALGFVVVQRRNRARKALLEAMDNVTTLPRSKTAS
jgi:hypothetical protein